MPHIHGKIDFTASAFIVHDGKVLLRRHDKYKIWLSVGGHIELDEDPNQAVIREVREEVGLEVKLFGEPLVFKNSPGEKDLIPPRFLNRHHTSPGHEHVDFVYFATADTDVVVQGETEISLGIHWFTRKELEDPVLDMKESTRYYALKALEEVR